MPSYVVRELRHILSKREHEHYGVFVTGSGIVEFLLKLGPSVFATLEGDIIPGRSSSNYFNRGECRGWHLMCCWDALENDVGFWLKSLHGSHDRIPFGDERLLCDLVDDVRAAGRRVDEID